MAQIKLFWASSFSGGNFFLFFIFSISIKQNKNRGKQNKNREEIE
jgi:hypothetical protein